MLLDGKTTSLKIKDEIKAEVLSLSHIYNTVPHLVIVQVGNNTASNVYIKNKLKAAEYVGVKATHIHFEDTITNEELTKHDHVVFTLNNTE